MPFTATKTAKGYTLEGEGNLTVLEGKFREATRKAKKDDGTIKKGDQINGLEFILKLDDTGNINAFKWEKQGDYVKQVPDPAGIKYPLVATLFVSGECAEAYQAMFANADKLKLPEGIAEGFKADINVGTSKLTKQLIAGDFSKPTMICGMLFDNAEAVKCSLDFMESGKSGGFGSSAQTEADKISDRVKAISDVYVSDSEISKLYVQLAADNEGLSILDFFRILFA